MTMTMSMTTQLAEQLEFHWEHALRPRLDGLTDDEYFWQPVPDCWTVHPNGGIDFIYPEPDPPPFTTIAWRLAHVIVGVFRDAQPLTFRLAPKPATKPGRTRRTPATALASARRGSTRPWMDGVRGLTPTMT